MKSWEHRLRELLDRNLMFDAKTRLKIYASNAQSQKDILAILEPMDEVQTNMFKRVLDERPWFLDQCAQEIEASKTKHRLKKD